MKSWRSLLQLHSVQCRQRAVADSKDALRADLAIGGRCHVTSTPAPANIAAAYMADVRLFFLHLGSLGEDTAAGVAELH